MPGLLFHSLPKSPHFQWSVIKVKPWSRVFLDKSLCKSGNDLCRVPKLTCESAAYLLLTASQVIFACTSRATSLDLFAGAYFRN